MAAKIRAAGKVPIVVWVRAPLDVCRARNALRPPGCRVPDVALTRSWLSLRAQPPTVAEGWARMLVVDGLALHQDAADPEVTIRRLANAPTNAAWALARARLLPAYRAAMEAAGEERADLPPRVAQSLRGIAGAMERGAASDARLGPALAKAGVRIEARQRKAWQAQVREQLGDDWEADPQDELVTDWTERVTEQVGSIRARVAPGMAAAVREAWRKGWSAAQLEAHWREHGIPLEDGGTAEGQCATVGRDAGHGLAQAATQAHQEALGADWYTWKHSGAANPDPEHLAANGKRFQWSKRPPFGHPGERRNCGCTAEPLLLEADVKRLRPKPEPKPAKGRKPKATKAQPPAATVPRGELVPELHHDAAPQERGPEDTVDERAAQAAADVLRRAGKAYRAAVRRMARRSLVTARPGL